MSLSRRADLSDEASALSWLEKVECFGSAQSSGHVEQAVVELSVEAVPVGPVDADRSPITLSTYQRVLKILLESKGG